MAFEPAFDTGPYFFDGIEVRRVWRKKQNANLITRGDFAQFLFPMKRRVIHNHDMPRREKRHKASFKPDFKNGGIRILFIVHRRDETVADFGGNQICPGEFLPENFAYDLFPSRSVPIFPVIAGIGAHFVRISPRFRRNFFKFRQIFRYFFLIPLFVTERFFSRAIFSRLSALLTA